MSALRDAAQRALAWIVHHRRTYGIDEPAEELKLRTALAQQEQEQEPVAWQWLNTAYFRKNLPSNDESGAWNPLYTAPPRREWRSLTDEDIALIDWEKLRTRKDAVRAVEARLRELNHG